MLEEKHNDVSGFKTNVYQRKANIKQSNILIKRIFSSVFDVETHSKLSFRILVKKKLKTTKNSIFLLNFIFPRFGFYFF